MSYCSLSLYEKEKDPDTGVSEWKVCKHTVCDTQNPHIKYIKKPPTEGRNPVLEPSQGLTQTHTGPPDPTWYDYILKVPI